MAVHLTYHARSLGPSFHFLPHFYIRAAVESRCGVCEVASVVSDSARVVARQAPLSIGFSRQEYWSGVPCPPPGDLPDSESLCLLHWQAGLYHKHHLGSPIRSQNLPLKYILIYDSLSPPPLGGSSTVSCPDNSKSLPSGFPLPTQRLERRPKPDHFITMLKMLHRRPTAVGCNPESYRWWKQSVHDLQ